MRATIFHRPGEVTVEERAAPEPGPGELRLTIAAAALCASDVRVYRGEKYAAPGVVPGHELAGVVDALGEGVEGHALGDRVVVCPILACGRCRFCARGRRNRCIARRTLGYDLDGGFAEQMTVPAELVALGHVLRVPPALPLSIAAITEPVACTLNSLDLLDVRPGTSLAILGAGPMGLLHVLLARAAGSAPIIVSEPVSERREVARRWGADIVVDPTTDDLEASVRDATDGYGVDAVAVSVGVAELANQALSLVARQGTVNLFAGFPPGSTIPLDVNALHYAEIVLSGSQNATTDQYRRSVALLGSLPHVDELLTHRYGIEQAPRAYDSRLSLSGLKSLVEFPGVDGR